MKPYSVLIVDDDGQFLDETKQALSANGYDVFTADTGRDAKKILRNYHPTVTLLDKKLPDIDGQDIVKDIKKVSKNTAFIIITAYGNIDSSIKGFREGIADYIIKPASFDTILERIENAISVKEEYRRPEEELQKAYKKLEENQMQLIQAEKLALVGRLAAGVAHEINNPLAVICGELDMLLVDKDKDEETIEALEIILEQAKRIKDITERLLEFSREKKLKLQPLDINSSVVDAISLLRYQSKMKNIEIVKDLKSNLPKVVGDNGQLQEVFLNIMLNAAQSIKKRGKLTIRTRAEKVTRFGRRGTDRFKLGQKLVVVEFKDTGKGMDEKTLKKVFDPFFSTKEKGTGLGLFVCSKIIENHNGIIEAQSKLGEGSTFIVKLSAVEGER